MDLLATSVDDSRRPFVTPFRATSLLPEGDTVAYELDGQTVAHEVDMVLEQARIDKIIPDASVTDEEIAELLSGEAEVLKGHGVLG